MNYYFHYTSKHHAQLIVAEGWLRPAGPGGSIYLSDEMYHDGASASSSLGIGDKPIEICFAIPGRMVAGIFGPLPAASRLPMRGGGREFRVGAPVSVSGAVVLPMSPP